MSASGPQRAELAADVASLLGDGDFDAAAHNRLLAALTRYLQATLPGLGRDEAVEVIDGAVLELLELAAAGRRERERDPAGLLLTITRRRGIDLVRRARRRDVPLEEQEESGDVEAGAEEERLLERLTSEEEIAAAMRRIAEAGRHELNEVIRVWVDVDEQFGTVSAGEVAARLGLDRSTVSRRMVEIRAFL